MHRSIFLLSVLVCVWAHPGMAFEAFYAPPGARAMGMNGVFAAQANDGTAIWYNPAGLMQKNISQGEFSFDTGQVPFLKRQQSFSGEHKNVKFIGGFLSGLPKQPVFLPSLQGKAGVGLAMLAPYHVTVDVTAPIDLLRNEAFGLLSALYRQVSPAIAWQLQESLSLGATLDYIWTDIECEKPTRCDEKGANGYGYSFGALWNKTLANRAIFSLSGLLRSKAKLGYREVTQYSLGELFLQYLPGRPSVRNITMGYNVLLGSTRLNINMLYEQTHWRTYPAFDRNRQSLDTDVRYRRWGSGGEVLMPFFDRYVVMLRGGVSRAKTNDFSSVSKIWSASLGLGLAIRSTHFIDYAVERRRVTQLSGAQSSWLWSLSYAIQY